MSSQATGLEQFLDAVRDRADRSGAFASCDLQEGMLVCGAPDAPEPAFYRLELVGDTWYCSLVTADRWLSESIESDLMHTGDKIEELIDEELVDQGFDDGPLRVEHFRSDDMLFTFRSPLPIDPASPEAPEIATKVLLAYQACFAELGDMTPGEDD